MGGEGGGGYRRKRGSANPGKSEDEGEGVWGPQMQPASYHILAFPHPGMQGLTGRDQGGTCSHLTLPSPRLLEWGGVAVMT